jgi:hypothetical protein
MSRTSTGPKIDLQGTTKLHGSTCLESFRYDVANGLDCPFEEAPSV